MYVCCPPMRVNMMLVLDMNFGGYGSGLFQSLVAIYIVTLSSSSNLTGETLSLFFCFSNTVLTLGKCLEVAHVVQTLHCTHSDLSVSGKIKQ